MHDMHDIFPISKLCYVTQYNHHPTSRSIYKYFHMTHKQALYILLALLVCCSYQLVPNRQSPIITNIIDMHLSADEFFYVAYNASHVGIYDAHTGGLVQMLTPPSATVSVSLSPDSRTIAVTQQNGYISLYTISVKNSEVQVNHIKRLNNKQMSNQSNIVGTCFTGKGAFLVILYNDGVIFAWTLEGLLAQGVYDAEGRKLACSPSSPTQFVVGTNATPNVTAELLLFSIDQQNLYINQKNISMNINQFSALNYISFNQAGTQIYVVGNSDVIIAYTAPAYSMRVFYQGVGIIYKFLITKSGRQFAFVNTSDVVVVEDANMLGQAINIYPTNSQTFALAQQGTRFIYPSPTNKAQLLDKCKQGQFYNQTILLCEVCSKQCTLCDGNKLCFQCAPKYFSQSLKCLSCGDRCQHCINSSTCTQCSSPFLLVQDKCSCDNGFYIQGDECVQGMQFWLFALITGGASLVLFCFAFVNIIIMRKKQAKKFLLADQD